MVTLAVLLVLGGGAAAAYVGVVVPNQPANVLRTAFINSVQTKQISTDGTFDGGSGSVKGTFSSAVNTAVKSADAKVNVTFSGISFPIEARLVQQNAYFKIGDLSTVSSLIGAFSPDAAKAADSLSKQVSNKWISVDSTIINQDPTAKCLMGLNWTLNQADIKQMQNQYDKHPFTTIKSTANDTVQDKAAKKFVLNISEDSFNKFGDSLQSLSIVKAAQKCPGLSNASTTAMRLTASKTTNKSTLLTVWVDKQTKHVVQIANSSKDGSTVVKLSYGNVSIAAPPNAVPILNFLGSLQSTLQSSGLNYSQLLGSGATVN